MATYLNKKWIIGKKIVDVRIGPEYSDTGVRNMDLKAIVLDDGSEIRFLVGELGYEYAVTPLYVKGKKEKL